MCVLNFIHVHSAVFMRLSNNKPSIQTFTFVIGISSRSSMYKQTCTSLLYIHEVNFQKNKDKCPHNLRNKKNFTSEGLGYPKLKNKAVTPKYYLTV